MRHQEQTNVVFIFMALRWLFAELVVGVIKTKNNTNCLQTNNTKINNSGPQRERDFKQFNEDLKNKQLLVLKRFVVNLKHTKLNHC